MTGDIADEDDLIGLLERPAPHPQLERNGFANALTMIDTARHYGLVESPAVEKLLNDLRGQAEIGLIFLDMHNQEGDAKWHEASAAWKARKQRHE